MNAEFTVYHMAFGESNWAEASTQARLLAVSQSTSLCPVWKTCLRQISFSLSSHIDKPSDSIPGFEILQGRDAYKFCLEVICGLHSPLTGETEVFGQFRDFVANYKSTGELAQLKKVFEGLVEDAKKVRQKHLTNLGSQSYGSLIRRHLKEDKKINILGAGRLARDIVPWLKSKDQIKVICRSPKKASEWSGHFKNVDAISVKDKTLSSAPLVIAAPMNASEIKTWKTASGAKPQVVIDLRETCETDPLIASDFPGATVQKLTSLFEQIQSVQAQLTKTVGDARLMISDIASQRHQSASVRPFGWDDLCA
jgi:glutamyl-tRNA reductase